MEGGAVPGRLCCCRAEGRGALYSDVDGGAVAVESGLSTLVVDESVVGLGVVMANDNAESDSLLLVCSYSSFMSGAAVSVPHPRHM